VTAQVIIGADISVNPQSFSLLELESNGTRGFRLPQMNTIQRDALTLAGKDAALGLQIFNTCAGCVETWNGSKWIQICHLEFFKPTMLSVEGGNVTIGDRLQNYAYTAAYGYYEANIPAFKMSPRRRLLRLSLSM
jgi:hypothetical protein